MAVMLDTELELRFGKPKIVMTKFGEREVRNAPATDAFWAAWREDKDALKKSGYSVSKNDSGDWSVSLWRETISKEERAKTAELSRATDAAVEIPIPQGLALLPYQKAGVAYAMQREGTLIADEMGLGKTVQAIATANISNAQKILVICPASLLSNWRNEIKRWQTNDLPTYIVRAGTSLPPIAKGWVIINYDIVSRYPVLKTGEWDLLIIDETHYLKNSKAKRTKWILGGGKGEDKVEPILAKKKLLLTGTPITNRPSEIFTLLKYLDPKRWTSFGTFAKRYCGGFFDGYGMQANGASNLDELQARLRETVMVRRLKADVLTELPAKRRQIIVVDCDDDTRAVVDRENSVHEKCEESIASAVYAVQKAEASGSEEEYKNAVAALNKVKGVAFTEMARVRHETAQAKLPAVIEHLDNTDGKVVVFAHHRDIVADLVKALSDRGVVSITGDTPNERRQEIVERFQTDSSVRFFVGNIQAAGVGITLTASSHVVFAELDWVPASLSQAEDRCHRIGQRGSVLVQHLVIDGSLDAKMAKTIVEKQDVISQALDVQHEAVEFADYVPLAPKEVEAQKPSAPVIELKPDQVQGIHSALRILAAMDTDRASSLNGMGFNKYDTQFGNELAQRSSLTNRQAAAAMKVVRKYRKQYSPELYQQIIGE